MQAGAATWDVVQVENEELAVGCEEGLFEKIDYTKIGGKDIYLPQTVDECGVGVILYPHLADVRIEHSWSGPVDRSYDSLPVFGHLPNAPHIFYGVGWSGNGVGPSRLGGRILASLALGVDDEWSRCGLVDRKVKTFPPEPARYLGGIMVRNAVRRKEAAEAHNQKPAWLDSALSRLAPSGLEDKST